MRLQGFCFPNIPLNPHQISLLSPPEKNAIIMEAIMTSSFIQNALAVRPSQRQLDWQTLEFIAFIHFGINTFYDQEWGTGKENPQKFNPDN